MKIYYLSLLVLAAFYPLPAFCQDNQQSHYTKVQVEHFIREVYANQADALVFKSPSDRMTILTNLLERLEVVSKPEFKGKKFRLLSELSLVNKYNTNVKRDLSFETSTFNPLKYQFPIHSKSLEIFRIDGTDFLIVIQPAK